MAENESLTKTIRINSIVDMPGHIEDMFALNDLNLLLIARSNDTLELWNTHTWIQLTKIPGVKGNKKI